MTELPDLVAGVLDHATGPEEVEAYAVHSVATTIQAGTDTAIRQIGRAETRGTGVRVIRDGRLGYASTSDLDPAALRLTVERARANAAASDPDEAQELPSPQSSQSPPSPKSPQTVQASDGLLVPAFEEATLADKVSVVLDLARRVVSCEPPVSALDTAEYHDERRTVAVASTRGVRVVHEVGYVELWADALGEDRGTRASDYAYQFGRSLADLHPGSLATVAVERTVRLLGPATAYSTGVGSGDSWVS